MNIWTCSYEQLPDWVGNALSDNGMGKQYAHYLLIEDGDYRAFYSDAMEPEDCRFSRDLKWIEKELNRVANYRAAI